MNNNIQLKKGFTLIEILTYLVLFTAIILTLMRFFFAIRQYQIESQLKLYLQESFIFIDQHFLESFRGSDSINEAQSDFNVAEGSLSLYKDLDSTFLYELTNQRLQVTVDDQNYFLTPQNILVTEFLVEPIRNAEDLLVGTRITLTLQNEKQQRISDTIETSYLLGIL